MSRTVLIPCLLLPLLFAGCDKAESGAEAAASASAPMTDEAIDRANIPVQADFEEEARKSITEDNVEAEVDALAKAIESDNP